MSILTTKPTVRYNDTSTIFCDTSVATNEQVTACLKTAIKEADKILKNDKETKFKVNLLVGKNGEYFGFGYVRVSNPKVYWMLLGRNPDGSERFQEIPDPNWSPPTQNTPSFQEKIIQEQEQKSWAEIAEDEELLIQPKIKISLPPLVTIPGYEYEPEQIQHLKQLEIERGSPIAEIPKTGYFEISRAYATDPPKGMCKNRICARNVPDWIPEEAFKAIFSSYVSDPSNKKYPGVNFINTNKGKIVFITFDPKTNDSIFCLLMTKKTRIVNPQNPNEKATLIFMHAFDNQK